MPGFRRFGRPSSAITIAALLVLLVVAGYGQQQSPDTSDSNTALLLEQLKSDRWQDRAKAFETLSADPNDLRSTAVQGALIDVLDHENHLVESTLRDSHEQVGVSEKYGEEFSEYVGALGATVDSFANWGDPRQVCIFVQEAYNPDSTFAAKIASHANVAAPCLMQVYGSDVSLMRAEAAAVLVQILGKGKGQLDSATAGKTKELVLRALHDPATAVRSSTVRALGKYGSEDMIPELERVAESDPSPEVNGRSIRKSASEAIKAIQQRGKM